MRRPTFQAFLWLLATTGTAAAATVQDASFAVEEIHAGESMVPIVFGPGGRLYGGEKAGDILLFEPDGAGAYNTP